MSKTKLQYGWNPKNVEKGWWEKRSRRKGPSLQTIVKRVAAADRRAQRQALQRRNQLVKQQAQIEKMQEKERAAYEVEVFENHLEMLVSVHQDCGEVLNWGLIAQELPPTAPSRSDSYERQATDMAATYNPGFFARLFGQEKKNRLALEEGIQQARQEDEKEYQDLLKQHREDEAEWRRESGLAARILKGEWKACLEAVQLYRPFADVEELGSSLNLTQGQPNQIVVTLHVKSERVIPSQTKSLLKSGKLSVKDMPQGRFNELYQDYVCGCVFRVARELFALIPVDIVTVHCYGNLFNASTGHRAEICLLSVEMPRDAVKSLNFHLLDPSDALSNFNHRMNFKKTKGFGTVDPL